MEIGEKPFLEELTAQSIVGPEPHNAALRSCRLACGLRQSDLASILGYKNPASIRHFELLRSFPDPETAQKLADILKVNSQELFPEWLKLHTKDRSSSREIAETDVDPLELNRARETEALLTAIDPQTYVEKSDLKDRVKLAIDEALTPLQQEVLDYRLGLRNGIRHNSEQTAEQFKTTIEDIHSIERNAFRRLRNPKLRLADLLDF